MAHIDSISLEDNFAFISQYSLCETQWRRVADFSDLTRRRRRDGRDGYRVHYKIRGRDCHRVVVRISLEERRMDI